MQRALEEHALLTGNKPYLDKFLLHHQFNIELNNLQPYQKGTEAGKA